MNYLKYLFLLLAGLSLFSCGGDDEVPPPPEEEEVITTLIYTFSSDSGDVVLRFEDLDGDGGDEPIITGGELKSGVDYNGSLSLLNESEDPAEDVNEEIIEEAEDHQFFFSNDLGMTIAYDDLDANDRPLGLKTKISNLAVGTGTLSVILKHKPVKSASGVPEGDITNAQGETDIEVDFPISIVE